MTRRISVGFVFALALAVQGLGGEAGIEQYLPADAFLTVCYYGDNPDVSKTAAAQLLAEPELQEALVTVRQASTGAARLAGAFLKANLEQLQPLLSRPVGLALSLPAGEGPLQVVLVAKVGKAGERVREQVAALLVQAGKMAGPPGKLLVEGIEVTQFGAERGFCFGLKDEFLILATSRGGLERALAANTPKLAAHKGFQRAMASDSSPLFLLLYDHAVVMERFGREMPPELRATLDALGVSGVRAAGLRMGVKGRALVGTTFLQTVGERKGLVRALAAEPVDRSLLRLAPRDAALAWLLNLDGVEIYEAIVAAIDAAMKGEGGARAAIAEFEKQVGVSLRDDLLGSLARGTLVTTSSGRSLLPAIVLSQGVKDADRFEAALGKLVAALHAAVKEQGEPAAAELRAIRFGDHTIRYLAMPGVMLPIAPCYARHGGRIAFALSPIHLKDYLAFLDGKEPSVLDAPGFKELEALVPKDATGVAYSDFGEGFVALYSALGPFLSMIQAIPGNPVALDLMNLPSARTIRKHMFGAISYAYATEDMIVGETHSPLGIAVLDPISATAVLGLGAGMAFPALADARTEARRIRSRNNLNQLAKASATYLNEFGDNRFYQKSTAELFEKMILADKAVLVAPNDPNPPEIAKGLPSSYIMCFDKYPDREFRDDFPPNVMMGWERAVFARDQGRRNVLFFDSHVEFVDEARFQELLRELDEEVRRNTKLRKDAPKAKGGEL
ncbi:MAG: hypothetical protein FJ290_09400 [Planctomycetes bacterium]|nr:hypothetical protein [Planctomycetota bacterium]